MVRTKDGEIKRKAREKAAKEKERRNVGRDKEPGAPASVDEGETVKRKRSAPTTFTISERRVVQKKPKKMKKKKPEEPADPEESDEDDWKEYYAIRELLMEMFKYGRKWFVTGFLGEPDKFNTIWSEARVRWNAEHSNTLHVFDDWAVKREGFESAKGIVLAKDSIRLPKAEVIGKGGATIGVLKGKSLTTWSKVSKKCKKTGQSKQNPKKKSVKKKQHAVAVAREQADPVVNPTTVAPKVLPQSMDGKSLSPTATTEQRSPEQVVMTGGDSAPKSIPVNIGDINQSPPTITGRCLPEEGAKKGVKQAAVVHANTAAKLKLKKKKKKKKEEIKGVRKTATDIAFPLLFDFFSQGKTLNCSLLSGNCRKDIISVIAQHAIVVSGQDHLDFGKFRKECTRKMQNIRKNFGEVMERLAGTVLQLAPELDADTPDLALGLLESGCGWLSAIVVSDAFQFFRRQVITVRHVQLIVLHVAARVSWRNLDMKQGKRNALVSSLNKVHLVAQEFIGNKVCSTDKGADGLVARLLADKSDKIVKAIRGLLVGWQKGGVDVESAVTLEEQKSAGTGEVTKSALGAGVTPKPECESDQKTECALERGHSLLTPSPFRSKPGGGEYYW